MPDDERCPSPLGIIHGRGRRSRTRCMSASLRKPSELAALARIDARCQNRALWLYNRGVNEASFAELSEWLTQAGLAGTSETDILAGCCDRCVAAGLPLARAHMFVDTLHPVHEGRLFRWGYGDSPLLEYGRTSPERASPTPRRNTRFPYSTTTPMQSSRPFTSMAVMSSS